MFCCTAKEHDDDESDLPCPVGHAPGVLLASACFEWIAMCSVNPSEQGAASADDVGQRAEFTHNHSLVLWMGGGVRMGGVREGRLPGTGSWPCGADAGALHFAAVCCKCSWGGPKPEGISAQVRNFRDG